MNTLRKIWENGLQLHEELYLTFKNRELVDYRVEPKGVENHYTKEVVNGLVDDLIENRMITFFLDVTNLSVDVPIWEIGVQSSEGNESEPLYIETFHRDLDNEDNDLHERGYDVPKPLHEFLGLEREISLTDF
jgi:hypothetical protein